MVEYNLNNQVFFHCSHENMTSFLKKPFHFFPVSGSVSDGKSPQGISKNPTELIMACQPTPPNVSPPEIRPY